MAAPFLADGTMSIDGFTCAACGLAVDEGADCVANACQFCATWRALHPDCEREPCKGCVDPRQIDLFGAES